jgi:steroid 5-alpha reductase family enzyme
MTFFELWALSALVILIYMILVWIVSVALKNASIVDTFWGLGFVLVAVTAFILADDGFQGRKVLITALVTIWGVRLAAHITRRNWGKGEDFRYQAFRQKYGPERYWWFSFFQVFLLQGVLLWIIAAPLVAAQVFASPDHFTLADGIGVLVWGVGFFFEAVGDWQLVRFKKNPANQGKVLDRGLWAYTRHPNYFGDAAVWWGYYLIALSTGWGALTIFSPALMSFLLVFVSGVAMLEKSMRQKPKYDDYRRRTSAFFPRPPRS